MDEHTYIPSAVRKQEAEAEAALEAFEAARSAEPLPDGAGQPAEDRPAAGAATRDDLLDDSGQQATPPAEGLSASAPAPATKSGEGETVSREEFQKVKSRLDVLLGKYNSEVPRYAARVKELEAENDMLNDRLEEAAAAAEVDLQAYRKYLSEEEQANLDENYADIQVKMARGIAEEIIEKRVKSMASQVEQLKQTIADLRSAQTSDSTARFWREVDTLAPGASHANASDDPGWVAFLGGIDPTSRLSYREIGMAAVNRGDAEAVANLFNLYRSQAGQTPPRRTAADQVKPATAPSAPKTQSRPAGRIINESEIKAFYQNAATSGLSEREIALKEAEFDEAAAEGRIRFGR